VRRELHEEAEKEDPKICLHSQPLSAGIPALCSRSIEQASLPNNRLPVKLLRPVSLSSHSVALREEALSMKLPPLQLCSLDLKPVRSVSLKTSEAALLSFLEKSCSRRICRTVLNFIVFVCPVISRRGVSGIFTRSFVGEFASGQFLRWAIDYQRRRCPAPCCTHLNQFSPCVREAVAGALPSLAALPCPQISKSSSPSILKFSQVLVFTRRHGKSASNESLEVSSIGAMTCPALVSRLSLVREFNLCSTS
jgi:hypothetical protein